MSDEEQIRAVLTDYFDGLYHGDLERFGSAFHPLCRLFTVADGELVSVDYGPYMERCAGRQAPVRSGVPQVAEILELTVSTADTAHARVRDAFPPRTFVNELTLAKAKGRWSIVCKVYHAFD
ncbi:nuclear transport factor 2 family protein [Azospirillum sp. ST 5-10]|uniref:nuclear transport factor 2 family protein n=1 Tax=unclassified Azospirillum TaxID=2630922 RepID=UPI003F49E719